MNSTYLKSVKEHYEALPYPPRNPEDERHKLWITNIDFLGQISHFCFAGRNNYGKDFRVLVAGGGTGDSIIFLAEQLRYTDAELVYLDLSAASMEVAKRRAEVRQLQNIQWYQASILDIPGMGLGKFDYVNCIGVLHHLESPAAGLMALGGVLKENGAMGLMVYGQYGRTSVYQMQELMRLINSDELSIDQKITNTREVIKALPGSSLLKSGPSPLHSADNLSDSDLYDLFLHSQDRAYTVLELYQWIEECGLMLVDFVHNKARYSPETFVTNKELLKHIQSLEWPVQQAIAENMASSLNKHTFFAAKTAGTVASVSNGDNIPYFCDVLPVDNLGLYKIARNQPPNSRLSLQFPNSGIDVGLNIGVFGKYFFKHINGRNSVRKIIQKVKAEEDLRSLCLEKEGILKEFREFYREFNRHNLIFLKAKSGFQFRTYAEMCKLDSLAQ